MKTSRTSFIEVLESRIAPAGLVDVNYNAATGALTLTGDGAANSVGVFQTGTNTYRIEGLATDIETGGSTFMDIGKLTSVTINSGGGVDLYQLTNLKTLTALTFTGGSSNDQLLMTEIVIKGALNYNSGGGADSLGFVGLVTSISGDVIIDNSAGTATSVTFDAETTTIGGRFSLAGGSALDSINFEGLGKVTIGKGIELSDGAGGSSLEFTNTDLLTIGKLSTGESILVTGGSVSDSVNIESLGAKLAGGIRMLGGAGNNGVHLETGSGSISLGKLPTGESILFTGTTGTDDVSLSGAKITLAGGIDLNAGEGTNSVTINGLNGPISIGKFGTGTSLRLAGGASADTVAVSGPVVTLSGGVELNGLAGTNRVDFSALGGRLTIGKTASSSSIDFSGTSGNDTVALSAAVVTLSGGVDFSAGDGTNNFQIEDPSGVAKLGKLSTGQSLLMSGGTGTDNISLESVKQTFAGGIEAFLGGGTNTLDLDNTSGVTTIGKLSGGASLLWVGGSGADQIDSNLLSLTFAGGIDVNAGDGANGFITTDESGILKIGTLPGGRSIAWTGGASTDQISLENHLVTLTGGVELTGGDGGNRFLAGANSVVNIGKFGTGQSVVITGTGAAAAEIDLSNVTKLAGSIEVTGGTGVDDIDLDGRVTVGKNATGLSISLTGNAGSDGIDLTDNSVLAGGIFFDGGADADLLDLDGPVNLTIGGGIEMIGGTGTDIILIDAHKLALTGGLTFNGGDDADEVRILADGFIGGNIQVDLGAAAAGTQVFIAQALLGLPGALQLRGTLTLDAFAGNTTADTFTLLNTTIAKTIDVELGGGVSTVTIDNLIAGDELKLNTGNGADVISIERGNFFGISRIAKLATINAGVGDDDILIGNPTPTVVAPFPDHTRVNFVGGLSLDGGTGAGDDQNDIAGQNDFGVAPTIIGVELNTLV